MIIFQLPTPTPLPTPESLPLELPEISLWDMSDNAIQTWNMGGEFTIVVQAVFMVMIIIPIVVVLFLQIRHLTTKD